MEVGICNLCEKRKELCNKSHIIPDFMCSNLKDPKQGMVFLGKEYGKVVEKPRFTGEFEGGILCEECDNKIIGSNESYVAKKIFTKAVPKDKIKIKKNKNNIKSIHISNVNFTRTKLFYLSILWRMSISTRPFFYNVDLGPYEEELRRMILDSNPHGQKDFPVFAIVHQPPQILITQKPTKHRKQNGIFYSCIIEGVIYQFYVSKEIEFPSYIYEYGTSTSDEFSAPILKPDHKGELEEILHQNIGYLDQLRYK